MESVEMESSATGSNPHVAKAKRKQTGRSGLSDSDLKQCIQFKEGGNYESTVTTEEEDMANCLIMLARGGGGSVGVLIEDSDKGEKKRMRKSSGEVSVSAVSGGYECKTCDKAFVSFQALGGHRASHHKKAKTDDIKPSVDQVQLLTSFTTNIVNVVTSSSSSSSSSFSVMTQSTKVHGCAICGSAFSSGQALGGHMRRHRATAISSISAAVEPSNKETAAVVEIAMNDSINNKHLSSLDLNLPAPDDAVEDCNRRFRQQFSIGIDTSSSATTAALGFSAPPLVGCYF